MRGSIKLSFQFAATHPAIGVTAGLYEHPAHPNAIFISSPDLILFLACRLAARARDLALHIYIYRYISHTYHVQRRLVPTVLWGGD